MTRCGPKCPLLEAAQWAASIRSRNNSQLVKIINSTVKIPKSIMVRYSRQIISWFLARRILTLTFEDPGGTRKRGNTKRRTVGGAATTIVVAQPGTLFWMTIFVIRL